MGEGGIVRYCRHLNPSPVHGGKKWLKPLLSRSWNHTHKHKHTLSATRSRLIPAQTSKQKEGGGSLKLTHRGDKWIEEEKEEARASAAPLVTSCLCCALGGIAVITPLTESAARSGLPSSLPPTPPLSRHSAAKWFIWLPTHIRTHILEHPVTGSVHRRLNTCPPTRAHTHTQNTLK